MVTIRRTTPLFLTTGRLTAFLLFAVSLLALALIAQNKDLKSDLAKAKNESNLRDLPREGMTAPTVAVTAMDGRRIQLGNIGQAQILVFIEPDCSYCQASVHSLEYLFAKLKETSSRIRIHALTTSGADAAIQFARRYGLSFPLARSTGGINAAFRISGVPVVLLVDAAGVVRWVHYGAFDDPSIADDLLSSVRKLGRVI